ncbi:MAG: two component transcriptional regulator, winged helix family [Candidatus Aminicenantes bacterium]|jgi:DNA-binding response OmpR family regulator|nr:two component transcriptional regulator, winged helix family [Candidatus Aminicenantes bacterium]
MKKILLIEDDEALRRTLTVALEEDGFSVVSTGHGREGLDLGLKGIADLIALDMVLPALGGLEICRELREHKVLTPIIMLSGRKMEEVDKVMGLETGADDYLLKPFGPREFLARVRAVLRRSRPESAEIQEFSFGDVTIHFKKQTATKGQKALRLTAKEIGLLKLLISHEGEVISRNAILNEVWGYEKFPTTRTVDTFIHNLRRKVENNPSRPRYLLTVPWSGYKFQR